ncbi:MAG: DUF433 domain-containing protein [Methanosarcinales archaeon]
MKFIERIWVDHERQSGKPCIRDTRIPIIHILELIDEGLSFEEIIKEYYPEITKEDIKACIQYARSIIEREEIYLLC